MAEQITNYKCPACDGPLQFSGTSGKLECEYCRGSYTVAEIEQMYKEENEKAAQALHDTESEQWKVGGMYENWGENSDGMKVYSCPSCGAELICNETTAATCCPYCGNQTIVPGQFSGSLKPEFIIPFKTDKAAAKAALLAHYKGKKLLPSSFVDNNHIEDIQGVYVPFWMFDCEAYGEVIYSASKSEKRRVGNEEITTTHHYNVYRQGDLRFEKVPVDASSRMPDEHMDSIEPYDYSQLKPFSMAYMPGFLADKYDVEAEECGKRMQERCQETFLSETDKTVVGYDSFSVRSKAVGVRKGNVYYAMMPVWLLATKWNDKSFLFAMNGQTGKLIGDLPVDKGKYWGYFLTISAVLIGIMMLINFVVLASPMKLILMLLLCIAIPLMIAFAICGSMKANMKSVHKQTAKQYISGKGLHISQKYDRFIRSSTKKRTLNNGK